MNDYKILQAATTMELEAMVKAAISSGDYVLYGRPAEFGGRKCQVVISGKGSDVPATNDQVLYRVAEAELKASGAALKASEARAAADAATSQLVALNYGMSKKADLLMGKVPYEQLPEFPVGRKLNVANAAGRLALPPYTDLTIAYESDTGDAWGLDANADPAISSNWSPLGNTKAIGVSTFNGRTGNVAPQAGDYHTGLISETLERRYVSPEQIAAWNAKPGPADINAAIESALAGGDLPFETKQHAADTYIAKADRAAVNGVAPLDSTGKVPAANLPNPADLSVYVLKTSRGAANGVAPLDSSGKLANSYLYRNAANGVAGLDANGLIPAERLPKSTRQWRDVKASRSVDAFNTNNTGGELLVYVRSGPYTTSGYIEAVIRKDNNDNNGLTFISGATTATTTHRETLNLTVPPGWQYLIKSAGGNTAANLQHWYEFS